MLSAGKKIFKTIKFRERRPQKGMFEIKGKINTAICYASVIEQEASDQIRRMC